MKGWYSQDGERTEMESKKRDILIEGAIMGLARDLALENFQESTRMTPAKTLSNSGEGAQTDLALYLD